MWRGGGREVRGGPGSPGKFSFPVPSEHRIAQPLLGQRFGHIAARAIQTRLDQPQLWKTTGMLRSHVGSSPLRVNAPQGSAAATPPCATRKPGAAWGQGILGTWASWAQGAREASPASAPGAGTTGAAGAGPACFAWVADPPAASWASWGGATGADLEYCTSASLGGRQNRRSPQARGGHPAPHPAARRSRGPGALERRRSPGPAARQVTSRGQGTPAHCRTG